MLVGPGAAKNEVRVTIDQPRGYPRSTERDDFPCPIPRKLGALADADDLALGDPDRAIFN